MSNSSSSSSGIGFFGLLTVLFVALKLTDVIAWSWWFVLMPFYGIIAVVALIGISAILLAVFLKRR